MMGSRFLLDFGGARKASQQHTGTMRDLVTPGFSPSEQYSVGSKKEGPWSDLYALGATAYQCIFGIIPTEATLRRDAILDGDPDPCVSAVEKGKNRYRRAFLEIIDWMIRLSPKERARSADEVIKRLNEVDSAGPEFGQAAQVFVEEKLPHEVASKAEVAEDGQIGGSCQG